MNSIDGVEIRGPATETAEEILSPPALEFLRALHREFTGQRDALLQRRYERRQRTLHGELPDFLAETRGVRADRWRVPEAPADLKDRRVEITGPTDRKMVINALNSGAETFMADFEDANSPTWDNMVSGQANLRDAVVGSIEFEGPDGKTYRLDDETATMMVRPRGWHLAERHVNIDGAECSGSLFDFGLYFLHNSEALLERQSGPYFYLPKLESHLEARLWNDVFQFAQDYVGIPRGTIRATVLIETVFAAFEMDEILFELREHASGLNAGRWDYIFSMIKTFGTRAEFVLPDRSQVTMTVPFMRAFTELLVKTCHARNAFAIGGMAAYVPSRRNPEVNKAAIAKVTEDKVREATDGFDGTWVAHPDLVPTAKAVFDKKLAEQPQQLHRLREDVQVTAKDLLDVSVPGGTVTEEGLRNNIRVGILYVESWLRGVGAAALNNLMEDVATAEIARAQIWQWLSHGVRTAGGDLVDDGLVRRIRDEEFRAIEKLIGAESKSDYRLDEANELFDLIVFGDQFVEFLTLPAYRYLD